MPPLPLPSLLDAGCKLDGVELSCPPNLLEDARRIRLPSWLQLRPQEPPLPPSEPSPVPPVPSPEPPVPSVEPPVPALPGEESTLPEWGPWLIGVGCLLLLGLLALALLCFLRRRRLRRPVSRQAFRNPLYLSSSHPSLSSFGSDDDLLPRLSSASSGLRRRQTFA